MIPLPVSLGRRVYTHSAYTSLLDRIVRWLTGFFASALLFVGVFTGCWVAVDALMRVVNLCARWWIS